MSFEASVEGVGVKVTDSVRSGVVVITGTGVEVVSGLWVTGVSVITGTSVANGVAVRIGVGEKEGVAVGVLSASPLLQAEKKKLQYSII